MYRLGLTGGIASGKSTVAAMLSHIGAAVIDADAISRETTAPDGAAIQAITLQFGSEFISDDGGMARERMRALVFQDPSAKTRLEKILHPLIAQKMEELATEYANTGHACAVFDIPLLVESAYWRKRLHRILVVDCEPHTQVTRAVQRSGLHPAQIQKIIDAQANRRVRLQAADFVLCNEGIDLQELRASTLRLGKEFGL